jgi:acyl carrier protein
MKSTYTYKTLALPPDPNASPASRIKVIIAANLVATDAIKDSDLLSDLGADSLDIVEIIMLIEEEFDLEIEDEKFEHVQTVGDIVKVVLK